jgi:CHAT domain-containing protein/tetratricopeptide (TPR) repeat protein
MGGKGDLLAKAKQIPYNLPLWALGEIRFTEWIYRLVLPGAIFSQLFFPRTVPAACQEAAPWNVPNLAGVAAFGDTRYLEALDRFREAWSAAEAHGAPDPVRGKILTNIGACLIGLSDYRGALAHLLRARPLVSRGTDRELLAAVDLNLASVYLLQDDRENAARLYRRALGWVEQDPQSVSRSVILANLAAVELRAGRHRQAVRYTEQALAGRAAPSQRASMYEMAGLAWLGLRDWDRAREALQRSLPLRPADPARSLLFLGRLELEKGNPEEALRRLGEAVAQARQRDSRVTLWEALYWRGHAFRRALHAQEAARDWREAAQLLEDLRAGLVPTDALRVQFEVFHHEVYAALAELLCEQGALEEAFHVVERGRAYSLRTLIRGRPGAGLWGSYAERLAQLEGLRAKGSPAVAEQEAALRDLEARLRVEDPVLSPAVLAPPLNLRGAQAQLDSATLLLNFFAGNRALYLWSVTDRTARLHRLPPSLPVRELVAAVQTSQEHRSLGRRLYGALFGAVPPEALARPHWVLALDGDLVSLPFAALTTPAGRYLAQEHALSFVPSLSVLQSLRERPARSYHGEFLAIADPVVNRADPRGRGRLACPEEQVCAPLPRLASSEAEARACARLFTPGRSTVLTGLDASESRLRQEAASSHRFWHFSSHVVVDGERPNHSFVALTLPEKLTVYDIVGLPVRAELVTLNGCDSGTGKTLPGAGVLGLARAFLAAGAQAVCATRWKIPDETGALVERMYAHLLQNTPRAEALQRAQIEMIRAADWRSEPRYWAAYFLVGDGSHRTVGPHRR